MTTRMPSIVKLVSAMDVRGRLFLVPGPGPFNRAVLSRLGQVSMKRRNDHVVAEVGVEQRSFDAANLRHARQKDRRSPPESRASDRRIDWTMAASSRPVSGRSR